MVGTQRERERHKKRITVTAMPTLMWRSLVKVGKYIRIVCIDTECLWIVGRVAILVCEMSPKYTARDYSESANSW